MSWMLKFTLSFVFLKEDRRFINRLQIYNIQVQPTLESQLGAVLSAAQLAVSSQLVR
jgi:hypothetical protein